MNCKIEFSMLQDYVEGTIDPLEKILLEEHLKTCRKCKKEVTELKLLFWELLSIDENEIDFPDTDEIKDKLIDIMCNDSENFTLKRFIDHQKNTLDKTTIYLSQMPGKKLLEKSLKKSSEIVGSTSKKVFMESIKIIKNKQSRY